MRTAKDLPTLKEGLRSISFAQLCAGMMFVIMGDESNPFQRRPNYGQIESEQSRANSQARRATRNTHRPHAGSDEGYLSRDECDPGGRFRALFEDEEFPLAHERPSLSRLSSASR